MTVSKHMRARYAFSFFLAAVLSFSSFAPAVFAQAQNSPALFSPPNSSAREVAEQQAAQQGMTAIQDQQAREQSYKQLVSCFDFYRFGSTPVVLTSELASVSAGADISFSGSITNENIYPLVDVTVYAKVFRKSDAEGKNVNGPDVVDFLRLEESLSLQPGETKPISYVWSVPADAEPGDYRIASYVATHDRFNMAGLSFTDDVTGGAHSFRVVGESRGAVRFGKDSVTVANLPFRFAAAPPKIHSSLKEVPVVAEIENTTNKPEELTVSWDLYSWDALREDALIDQKTEDIRVEPGERTPVSFTVTDTDHSVYYAVGSFQTRHGSVSRIGVRFVRTDVNEPRLNFVGLSQSPDNTSEGAIFACAHSTGTAFAPNSEIKISVAPTGLLGILNIPFLTHSYKGPLPGEIIALPVSFSAPLPASAVTAELYQDDELIDAVTVSYSCEQLGELCGYPWWAWMPLAVVLILIIVVAATLIARMRKNDEEKSFPESNEESNVNNQRL